MDSLDALRSRSELVRSRLVALWPEAKPLLHYRDCFELLCAVMLSAQCTDDQVNRVTPALFARFPDPRAMAGAELSELESLIHSVGFFRTKAFHLVEASRRLLAEFGGSVPGSIEELLTLPGVGRKTANLVASSCAGTPGIIVDTHVLRVALRLGLHERRDAEAVERRIAELCPREGWTAYSHALNRHGKHCCTARAPACLRLSPPAKDRSAGGIGETCPLEDLCPRKGL